MEHAGRLIAPLEGSLEVPPRCGSSGYQPEGQRQGPRSADWPGRMCHVACQAHPACPFFSHRYTESSLPSFFSTTYLTWAGVCLHSRFGLFSIIHSSSFSLFLSLSVSPLLSSTHQCHPHLPSSMLRLPVPSSRVTLFAHRTFCTRSSAAAPFLCFPLSSLST